MTEDAHYQQAREAGDLQRYEDASPEQRRDWRDERTGQMRSTIERERAIGQELVTAQAAIEAAKDYQSALVEWFGKSLQPHSMMTLVRCRLDAAAAAIERALALHNGE